MTPILYSSDEVDFLNNGLGQLWDLYDVDIHEQRNGLLNLTAYYPVNGQHYADISEGNIILAKPSPLDDNHAFRIVSVALDITGYAVMIEADSITYDLTNNLSKTIHMLGDGQAAMTAIQNSTLHPHIFTFYSDITHTSESQLRYVNPMEAIAGTQGSFLQIWGGELKRENRRVAMFNRRGRDNVATFRLGKNIAGLKYTVDVSNLTTEIVPTVAVNSTDVSRTIEGATVQSSRMGNYPLVYSKMVDVSQDVKVDEGDTDDQIKAKINAFAADWFVKSANTGKDLPEVTVEVEVESLQDSADYADKFAKLETIGLTDTVTVYVPEFGVNVTAIVNELHYDPVAERVTKLSIGTAKASWADSNKNALNDLQDKVTEVKEQATQAVISANGKNSIYSGRNEPEHPQEGDTWFWDDGTDSGIRVFTNGKWVDSTDTKTLERINNAVDSAIDTSKKYVDDLNAKQAQTTNALNEKVDKSVKELTDSQQAISSQATAYTNSAVADANAKAVQIGATTAQNAQQALSAAKKDLANSIASQASQTASMASDVTSKANQYANQAKSEAIAAATSADGVVRTDFKKTADSMTATIQQNKSDADGKITKAQTTATQALDGLSTKVEKTEYNKTTGDLTSKINTASDTAEKSKQDIVDIKVANDKQDNRMLQIEKDATGVKQTVSDLSTEQGKQSGSISKLEQRADGFDATVTKVNNLSVGGRNLLLHTNTNTNSTLNPGNGQYTTKYIPFSGGYKYQFTYTTASTNWAVYQFWGWVKEKYEPDTDYVLSFMANFSVPVNPGVLFANGSSGNNFVQQKTRPTVPSGSDQRVVIQLHTNTTIPTASDQSLYINGFVNNVGTFSIWDLKIEEGNVATDWTPAPEDLSSATAKAQLKADEASLAISNYKTDADGRISKAQADIKVNADAITQKVGQSDYNTKTGELTTSVNKAQQTADSATQTIGTYKESNDRRVQAAETNIHANSEAIKATVSKTDFDRATGKLTGDISTLQQRADGFEATVTKVNNLAVGGRNLLLGTSTSFTGIGNNSTNGNFNDQGGKFYLAGGKKVSDLYNQYGSSGYLTLSFDWVASGTTISGQFNPQWNGTPWGGLTNSGAVKPSGTNLSGHYESTVPLTSGYSTGEATGVMFRQDNLQGNVTISNLKLEAGNVATDWSPAPEDAENKIAQVKVTADGVHTVVSDPTTGLSTRMQKAEGTLSTVSGTDIPALKKATFWQPYSSLNFNDYTKQGSFFFDTTATKTNGPTSSNSWIYLIVDQGTSDNSRIKQTAWYDGVNGVKITYARTLNSGTWSPWYANDNDSVTTISQTNSSIQREITDRQNGDQAVRTDMATLINQQVTSVTKGYQSAITQTADGIIQQVGNLKIRYVRFASDGNTMNTGNHYQEFALYATNGANLLDGKVATTTGYTVPSQYPITSLTDGKTTTTAQIGDGDMSTQGRWAFFDIGSLVNPDYIAITPYYYDGRRHQNVVVQVSADNLYWRTVYQGAIQTVAGDVARSTVRVPVNGSSFTSFTEMFRDNFAFGIKDNVGNIISGINGDPSGMTIAAKKLTVSADTTFLGTNWLNGAIIKNASISTVQIADASITSAKIANLDVNKLSGNVTNFIRSYWSNAYGSQVSINANLIKLTAGSGNASVLSDRLQFKNGSSDMSLALLPWTDIHGHLTNAIGSWLLTTGPANSFVSFDSPEGGSFMTFASSQMNYGANTNIVRGMLNIFSQVNISNGLYFYGHPGNTPSYISVDDGRRTMNFYTGNKSSSESDGNYFWFNQNVYSSGTFASTSRLSQKNIDGDYNGDALNEIAKTEIVKYHYKNNPRDQMLSPVIDDVNEVKRYYIPDIVNDGKTVNLYAMISLAWEAIKQLEERTR
ncbi:phage tail spike protein [Weissella confusa]|uniref:phage tail spike protein n=1 Tax=Weissella confusa TaxID=1583 RepID=UPI0014367890|nr:phage tail spike protein [Weissella confusa]